MHFTIILLLFRSSFGDRQPRYEQQQQQQQQPTHGTFLLIDKDLSMNKFMTKMFLNTFV